MDDKPETHEEQSRRLEIEGEYGEKAGRLVYQVGQCDSKAADRLVKLFKSGEISKEVIARQRKPDLDNLMTWDSVTGGHSYWSSVHDKMKHGKFYDL